jgi:hypothetical protein
VIILTELYLVWDTSGDGKPLTITDDVSTAQGMKSKGEPPESIAIFVGSINGGFKRKY